MKKKNVEDLIIFLIFYFQNHNWAFKNINLPNNFSVLYFKLYLHGYRYLYNILNITFLYLTLFSFNDLFAYVIYYLHDKIAEYNME